MRKNFKVILWYLNLYEEESWEVFMLRFNPNLTINIFPAKHLNIFIMHQLTPAHPNWSRNVCLLLQILYIHNNIYAKNFVYRYINFTSCCDNSNTLAMPSWSAYHTTVLYLLELCKQTSKDTHQHHLPRNNYLHHNFITI